MAWYRIVCIWPCEQCCKDYVRNTSSRRVEHMWTGKEGSYNLDTLFWKLQKGRGARYDDGNAKFPALILPFYLKPHYQLLRRDGQQLLLWYSSDTVLT